MGAAEGVLPPHSMDSRFPAPQAWMEEGFLVMHRGAERGRAKHRSIRQGLREQSVGGRDRLGEGVLKVEQRVVVPANTMMFVPVKVMDSTFNGYVTMDLQFINSVCVPRGVYKISQGRQGGS